MGRKEREETETRRKRRVQNNKFMIKSNPSLVASLYLYLCLYLYLLPPLNYSLDIIIIVTIINVYRTINTTNQIHAMSELAYLFDTTGAERQ